MSRLKIASLGTICLGLAITSGCASKSSRKVASEEDSLSRIIDEIRNLSTNPNMTAESCTSAYGGLYDRLYNLAGDMAYQEMGSLAVIDNEIQSSFEARIALKDNFRIVSTDPSCIKSVSDVFRGLRYVEDYLIELRMQKATDAPIEYVNMTGKFPYLLVNPKYKDQFKSYEDLQSGDVVLSRGNAYSSAAIARIGTNDHQFSHLSFIYKDPETKEILSSQAHIEIGSVTAPISDDIAGGNARSVIFRYSDSDVAHKASKFMFDRVLERQKKKDNIVYDFSMDYKNDEKLFCSEIIAHGFKNALPNEDYFPMFKTKFSAGLIPFLNAIGVPVTKNNVSTLDVFAPGDIQFDPRFEMVAEWRNPKKMEDVRIKDFILTKIFERMDHANYQFDVTIPMDATAKAIWLLRRTPAVKKALDDKVSATMTPTQIEVFMVLDKVGDEIYKEIEKVSLEYARPMTPKEIYTAIDKLFKEDFELYKRYKKGQDVAMPVFHRYFHP